MEEKVRNIIIDQLGVDDDEVKPEAKLMDDLGADSLDIVELTMGIEEKFEIEIGDEVALKFITVGDIHAYLRKQGI